MIPRPVTHGETVTRLRPPTIPDPDDPDATTTDSTQSPDEAQLVDVAWHTDPQTLEPDPPRRQRAQTARIATRDPDPDVRIGDTIRRDDGTDWEVTGVHILARSPFTGWQPGATILCQRPIG